MTPRFLSFLPFIFEWECEYDKQGNVVAEHDPDDAGGTTKYGIDQRSHPSIDIEALTKDAATTIYWTEWLADGCEPMPSPYAEVFFNCAVNMGLGRARQFDKGIPGADATAFLKLQDNYYHHLAENNNRLAKYLKGWLNRTAALRHRFSL